MKRGPVFISLSLTPVLETRTAHRVMPKPARVSHRGLTGAEPEFEVRAARVLQADPTFLALPHISDAAQRAGFVWVRAVAPGSGPPTRSALGLPLGPRARCGNWPASFAVHRTRGCFQAFPGTHVMTSGSQAYFNFSDFSLFVFSG